MLKKWRDLSGKWINNMKLFFIATKKEPGKPHRYWGSHLKHALGVHETDCLGPMDDVDVWLNRILCSDGDPVLVGHLPFLDKLASRLVAADENMQIVSFQNSGMVCLEDNNDNKNFSVKWAITPDMIT